MNVSEQNARQSLHLTEEAANRARRAVAASYASDLLILWGFVWLAGYLSLHFSLEYGGRIFGVLDVLGVIGTFLICRKWPIRNSAAGGGISSTARRIVVLWVVLFAYAGVWLLLFKPTSAMLVGVFLVTVVMLGYVVTGLWSRGSFIIWLGLVVTGLALFGYYVIPRYFNLWMAPTGGGALLGTGLYIHIRWR